MFARISQSRINVRMTWPYLVIETRWIPMYLGNGKICFHSFELHFTYCIQLLSEEDRAVSLFLHAFPPRKLGHVISPAVVNYRNVIYFSTRYFRDGGQSSRITIDFYFKKHNVTWGKVLPRSIPRHLWYFTETLTLPTPEYHKA